MGSDIGNIFQMAHMQYRIDDLTPLTEELYVKWNVDRCSFEEWSARMTELGYDVSRFHVYESDEDTMYRFFYVGEYATSSYIGMPLGWMEVEHTVERSKVDDHYKQLFEEQNYGMYFFPEGNSFAVDYFIRHHHRIPEDMRFEVFHDLYTMLDGGFSVFPKGLLQEMVSLAPSEESQRSLAKKCPLRRTIRVYRGEHSRSTPLEEALSWTTSIKVAKFFANRYKSSESGAVYRAEIPIEKVIYYSEDRNEEEVWVRFEDLEKVKKIRK